MNPIDDFLKEAQNTQHVAFYSAEHDQMVNAQAYATIALAQAVIALVERLDRMTSYLSNDKGESRNALRTIEALL